MNHQPPRTAGDEVLKPEDAASLISQTSSHATVLVGGQAVYFWATRFDLVPRMAALTRDIDYQGTKAQAVSASRRLTQKHTLTIADMGDATPNAAVLAVRLDGYDDPIIIDYLTSVFGLNGKQVTASAVEVEIAGERLLVLHPVLLLEAKIWNLARLPAKQTPAGQEQARLSIDIVAHLLRSMVGERAPHRDLLKVIKRVATFAVTAPACEVLAQFGLDCMHAIPEEVFAEGVLPSEFHEKHWPRILESLKRRTR